MALNIIGKDQPILIKNVKVLLYGMSGAGKSTLAGTAGVETLVIDFDRGAHRSLTKVDVLQPTRWEDVIELMTTAGAVDKYDSIVVDTIDAAQVMLIEYISRNEATVYRGKFGQFYNPNTGAPTMQGWGIVASSFMRLFNWVCGLGKDAIFLAQQTQEVGGPDEKTKKWIPMIAGQTKSKMLAACDICGYVNSINGAGTLDFTSTDEHYGKDAGQLGCLPLPKMDASNLFWLKNHLAAAKDNMRTQKAGLQEEFAFINTYAKKVSAAEDGDTLDILVQEYASVEKPGIKAQMKTLIRVRAEELGLTINKETKKFGNGPTNPTPAIEAPAAQPVATSEPSKASDLPAEHPTILAIKRQIGMSDNLPQLTTLGGQISRLVVGDEMGLDLTAINNLRKLWQKRGLDLGFILSEDGWSFEEGKPLSVAPTQASEELSNPHPAVGLLERIRLVRADKTANSLYNGFPSLQSDGDYKMAERAIANEVTDGNLSNDLAHHLNFLLADQKQAQAK